jgi:hypothetical protein
MQRYTYEFSSGLRAVVDEITNCEDIFFNTMVADDTGKGGLMADTWKDYSCSYTSCGRTPENSISMAAGHLEKRSRCVATVSDHFGYMPLVESTIFALPLKPKEDIKKVGEEKNEEEFEAS